MWALHSARRQMNAAHRLPPIGLERIAYRCVTTLVIAAVACKLPNYDDPVGNRGLIDFQVADSLTVPVADGARVDTLLATLDPQGTLVGETVTFTTTLGTLLGSSNGSLTVPVDASRQARALLRTSSDTGVAIVTASAVGLTMTRFVKIAPAPATTINLSAASPALKIGIAPVTLTATFARSVGTPTPGYVVDFTAVSTGQSAMPIGSFGAPSLLATSNTITNVFAVVDTSYVGPVRIVASAHRPGNPADTLSAAVTIQLAK